MRSLFNVDGLDFFDFVSVAPGLYENHNGPLLSTFSLEDDLVVHSGHDLFSDTDYLA